MGASIRGVVALAAAALGGCGGGSAAPDAACESGEPLFLNRAGGSFTASAANDARDNRSAAIMQDGEATGFPHGDDTWEAMVACVRGALAPYDVAVVLDDPGVADHREIVVTGTAPDTFGLDPNYAASTPFNCLGEPTGVGFVFAINLGDEVPALCQSVALSAGTLYGLEVTMNCADVMTFQAPCGEEVRFRDTDSECGFNQPQACICGGGTTQNSHRAMLQSVGASTCPR